MDQNIPMINTAADPKKVSHPIDDADRQDLLALLNLRFGTVPSAVMDAIMQIGDFSQIDHLILVGANAAGWQEFVAELQQPGFQIAGPRFEPLNRKKE